MVVMLMTVCSIYAQREPGSVTVYPRVGVNWSKHMNDQIYIENDDFVSATYLTGFTGGADVQYQLTNALAISGGLMYSQQGTKFEYDIMFDEFDERPQFRTHFVNIPLMAVMTTRYGVSFKAGLQPEIRVGNRFEGVFNRVNLSVPVGVAYEWNNVCLDLRYNIGVTSIYKGHVGGSNCNNRTIMLTLGYGIDL